MGPPDDENKKGGRKGVAVETGRTDFQGGSGSPTNPTYFLALLFAPFDHSTASAASCLAASPAAFAAAASALRAWPATFLLFSAPFLPPMLVVLVLVDGVEYF